MNRKGFDTCIDRLLSHEGGFTDNRNDPGNWTGGRIGVGKLVGTKFGIAANTYPTLDIKNLTRAQATEIYYRDFWLAIGADKLPGAVAFSALDGAVNSGVRRSVQWLQKAAGIADDGLYGPQTATALAQCDPNDLLLRYNAYRLDFMSRLPAWKEFSAGWVRRIAANLLYGAKDN